LRLEHDGSITELDADLSLSNGLAWSPDGAWFYSADTHEEWIYRRRYGNGEPGRREAFIDVHGRPDGITVDTVGRIWVTVFDRGHVAVFSQEGTRLDELSVPVADLHPTSVEFIGTDRKELLLVTGYPECLMRHGCVWKATASSLWCPPTLRGLYVRRGSRLRCRADDQ
jgi:sugar lactone lactonase YvrE